MFGTAFLVWAICLVVSVMGWDPRNVTSGVLKVWLDGADPLGTGILPADGGLCQWNDKSGSQNHGIAQNSASRAATTTQSQCAVYAGSDRSVSLIKPATSGLYHYYKIGGYSGVPEQEEIFVVFELKDYSGGYKAIVGASTPYGR